MIRGNDTAAADTEAQTLAIGGLFHSFLSRASRRWRMPYVYPFRGLRGREAPWVCRPRTALCAGHKAGALCHVKAIAGRAHYMGKAKGRKLERTTRPCRPPLLTLVCKRGGRPPSAFRLLPCGCPPGACSPARCNRVGLPILIVLGSK